MPLFSLSTNRTATKVKPLPPKDLQAGVTLSINNRSHTLPISSKKYEIIALLVAALLWGSLTLSHGASDSAATRQPLVAAVHVHSTMSTGSWTLDEVVLHAEAISLDAVVLSENFSLRYEYGLPPARGALRVQKQFPSVMEYGIKNFLQEVEKVQARHPTIVVMPGVEVAPYYHWTGSLWDGTLTMHDAQKNLLVLGLAHEDDYAAIPALGNNNSYQYGLPTALNLSPVLLLIPAVWRWWRNARQSHDGGHPISATWPKVLAYSLAGIGLALLFNAWPFTQPPFSPYASQLAHRPYQAVIDTVAAGNGVAIWSLTEARDFSQQSVNPWGNVTIKTDPHPEMLLQTNHYAGFGGVYQDTRTINDPGGVWDQVLNQYLSGQRGNPPFTYGEIAFHTQGQAGIKLDQVLTVFLVHERTTEGILEAMRTGHHYAVGQYQNPFGLRLNTFRVACKDGNNWAESGETLFATNHCVPTVNALISATDQGNHPISIRVIRSGLVVKKHSGHTPFELQFSDEQAPVNQSTYYRMDVHGSGEILSNPIFVMPMSAR